MAILVTGGAGVVGSALLAELAGDDVVALAHLKPIPGATLRGDVTRAWLGLHPRDYRELAARVEVVVHCAGSVDFGASAATLHRQNVVGTGHVLRLVADANARLVHVSTAFISRVLGDAEAGRRMALGLYAESKARSETLVRESGLPATIARLSTVIGDSESGQIARVQAFHAVLVTAIRDMLPFLPAAPQTLVDLVPQDVAAQALAALARREDGSGERWITAGPAALPMSTVVDVAYERGVQRLRSDPRFCKLYAPAFKTRLLAPDTFAQVMKMLYADADPSVYADHGTLLDRLMATYNGADLMPTSLGEIPGGPQAPTRESVVQALSATCRYLDAQAATRAERSAPSRPARDRWIG